MDLGHHAVVVDGAEECDWPLVFPLHGEDAVVSLGGEDLSLCKFGGGHFLGDSPSVAPHCPAGTEPKPLQGREQRYAGVIVVTVQVMPSVLQALGQLQDD